MAPKPAPQPAPVPVFMGTIVDPAAVQPAVEPSQEETPEEVTSTVELVHTPLGLGLSIDGRNKVTEIDDDSQAGRSGLIEVHDRLVSINGQKLSSLVAPEVGTPLDELLGAIEVGSTMIIEIARVVSEQSRRTLSHAASTTASASASKSNSTVASIAASTI